MFHPRKKTPSIQMKTQKRGLKKNPGREMPLKMMEAPPFGGVPSFSLDRASRPRECTLPRPSLAEFDGGAPSFAGATEGCRVGRAWRDREAAGGPVAVGRAGASRGILKPNKH